MRVTVIVVCQMIVIVTVLLPVLIVGAFLNYFGIVGDYPPEWVDELESACDPERYI